MRLSISNIAWHPEEDEAVARLLAENDVDSIDVAPSKYFLSPLEAKDEEIIQVRKWWSARGIQITGMQSLLFGTTGLNIFGPPEVQEALLNHLSAICKIGALLEAKHLVFGSPRNRDRSGLSNEETTDIAVSFFQRLGEVAHSYDVVICLEPNPVRYGANFMVDSAETAAVVRAVAHPAIQMQLDTGSLFLNHEPVQTVLEQAAPLIGHIHASEPDLAPLGSAGNDHAAVWRALQSYLPHHVVCIEMLASKTGANMSTVESAIKYALTCYRPSAQI